MHTQVVIVGAGPVGLCLAIDLADRGIRSVVVDTRYPAEVPSVRCNHVAARTMESFRQMGLAEAIRALGLPDDFPNDIVFRPVGTREEFARIVIPGRQGRVDGAPSPDDWWPTPEPPHRVNQIFFEPLLFRHAAAKPEVTILSRSLVEDFTQDADSVTVRITALDSGDESFVTGDFLVGCDGGRSMVRKQIGARLEGDAVIQTVQSTYFRAPTLNDVIPGAPGWMTYLYHPVRAGSLLAIDGQETWLLHNYLLPGEDGFDAVDRDSCLRMLLGVDADFHYEVLANEDWIGRRMVADRFRDRRAFICGDAAHLWVPYAGYGMNAGIADGLNLSWKLAAYLQGWGGEAMLDAYEAERKPITEQVSRFAMSHAAKAIAERTQIPANFLDHDAAGAQAREELGAEAHRLHLQQFACAGLNFGYYYEGSPLIAHDGEDPPAYTMYDYAVSTVPGCRLPHFWLGDGRSLYDAIGRDHVLLRFDSDLVVEPLIEAARLCGMPLTVFDVTGSDVMGSDMIGSDVPPAYRHALVIARPDRHVAWRGDQLPADIAAFVEQLAGARVQHPEFSS